LDMSSVLSIECFDMLVFESHPKDSVFLHYRCDPMANVASTYRTADFCLQ
jgi:hypothetical protein